MLHVERVHSSYLSSWRDATNGEREPVESSMINRRDISRLAISVLSGCDVWISFFFFFFFYNSEHSEYSGPL